MYRKRIRIIIIFNLLLTGIVLFAQNSSAGLSPAITETSEDERLSLAISSSDYPVTPGDIYRLIYTKVGEHVEVDVLVESNYNINLNVFGTIDGRNKSYPELKAIIETKILKAYPQSTPLLSIASLGIFRVLIKGEVQQSRFILTWGFSHLSEVVKNMLGPYSSVRDVGIESGTGQLKKYDLFRAELLGETQNDPILKPGDTILIYKRGKIIEIRGEVYRTGKYQLKDEEKFEYVIDTYAKGFTPLADLSRIKVERTFTDNIRFLYYNLNTDRKGLDLVDGDIITVPSKLENNPVIFIEGAISLEDVANNLTENQNEYNRRSYPFVSGETVYDVLRKIEKSILSGGDLRNSYLLHTGVDGKTDTFALDIEQLLYNRNLSKDIPVEPFDKIVIPLKQMNIAVQGDVRFPGNYPALPGQNYIYYLNTAGGPIHGTYFDNIVTITGTNGNFKTVDEAIYDGDKIIVTQAYINVFGAVSTPGQYPYSFGKTTSYYLGLAGGTTSGTYSNDTIAVTGKDGESKNPADSIDIGDMIIVSQTYINVFGAVSNPGQYPFSHDKPLAYYLGLAGGTRSGTYSQDNIEIKTSLGDDKSYNDPLKYGDMIIVTEIQINISGAVFMPGRYPYKEGKTFAYYINLAGGIDQEQNKNNEVIIYDAAGRKKNKTDVIMLDDSIFVPSNTFLHNFNSSLPLISTLLTVVNTVITVITLIGNAR